MVQIRDPEAFGDIFESAIPSVAVQPVLRPFPAVGDVQILMTVGIHVDDRHRRPHGGDLRHDVRELLIECRTLVQEVDASLGRRLRQREAVA